MAFALDKELLVVCFINNTKDFKKFTINDIMHYMGELWNLGNGPIICNFTKEELEKFLLTNKNIIKNNKDYFWIDRSHLKNYLTDKEIKIYIAKELNMTFNIPKNILKYAGYDFITD